MGDGLYWKDKQIAYCKPFLTEKILCRSSDGNETYRYFAKALFPDGTESEIRKLTSLDKFSCFELWQCPDVSPKGKSHVTRMLQLQAALMEAKEEISCHSGLQQYRDYPIYILGDKVIGAEKLGGKIVLESSLPYAAVCGMRKEDLICLAERAMRMLPGISEIIVYYSLQAVVKPILHRIGIDTNYTLAITGPSGHLKTSMAKKICLWLWDRAKQQTAFSAKKTTKRIFEEMDACSGMNYLVDDFHAYPKTQDMDRQDKRLDDIVRYVEENPDCANVVITGEFIQGIFSCIDRLLVVQIPIMKGIELEGLKEKLTGIPDSLMSEVAYVFAGTLLENLNEVEEKCAKFYQNKCMNPEGGILDVTRTYRHGIFLQLTEFLYRTYLCGGSERLSAKEELTMAIKKQYGIQQEQLMRIKEDEKHDYVSDVIAMLAGDNKYIKAITDSSRYSNYEDSYLQKGDEIYITRSALIYGMMKYSNRRVNINRIIRQLEDEGILNRGTDSITKKFRGIRHYVIRCPVLELYAKCKAI